MCAHVDLREANNVPEFATRVRDHVLKCPGKSLWAEKTPRNIRTIGKFISTFPRSPVIHLVRDPRDVITSLMGRRKSLINTIESWLGSVSAIQPYSESAQVLQIRYEDLCRSPEETISSVFSFLNVSDDTRCILSDQEERSRKLPQGKFKVAARLHSPSRRQANESQGVYPYD